VRYGVATQMTDLASPANNAFSLRGTDFYFDLLADPDFARHYLGVIAATMIMAYRFIGKQFGKQESVRLANCNAAMISPEVYAEVVPPHEIRFIEKAAASQGAPPRCDLHHCSVPTEPFAEVHRAIPGLRSLQAAAGSDIRAIRSALPGVAFSGMINPVDLLNRPHAEVLAEADRAIEAAVNDLALWDVDPAVTPARLGSFLPELAQRARRLDREPRFSFIPIAWGELDWESPQYQGEET